MSMHSAEVDHGERFRFGENWRRFLSTLNAARIEQAELSLRNMLGDISLADKHFLDMGCGSGLFSLAARRLGAQVHSFDYDPQSVACTAELKHRYYPDDKFWTIEEGSVLDEQFLVQLGSFDVVYSWGVLHHTGAMYKALENARIPVKRGGHLYIAIYNDEGLKSRLWAKVKRFYCSGLIGRISVSVIFVPYFALRTAAVGLLTCGRPWKYFAEYSNKRGMSAYHDWIDWLGGYPFEVARPEDILHLYVEAKFTLTNLVTTNRTGCNEFLFRRD